MSSASSPTAKRSPLDRRTVLAAGVALADAEGVEAVSMRRLAHDLGVVPMALYKHVADKEDLLDGMVDVVLEEYTNAPGEPFGPEAAPDWRAAARERILAARASLAVHPWLRRAIETRTLRTPIVLAHMENLSRILMAGGLSADQTHHAMHVLGNRIWGFSPELFTEPSADSSAPPRRSTAPAPDPAHYPAIMAITADAAGRRGGAPGCDEDYEFTLGVDLILDAIERLRIAGWTSPAPV
jgi:AcrR family transcriptional regulator